MTGIPKVPGFSPKDEEGGAIFWVDPEWDAFRDDSIPLESRGEFPGSALLQGAEPKTLLKRLHTDDSLGLTKICMERLQERAILWCPERILPVAMACVAHDSPQYSGWPELGVWLRQRVDKSIHLVLSRVLADENNGVPCVESDLPLLELLTESLGFERTEVRRALLEFHALPPSLRLTFQAIFVEHVSLEDYAATTNTTVERIEDLLFLVLDRMGSFTEADSGTSTSEASEGE